MDVDAYWYEEDGSPPWRGYVLTDPQVELLARHVFPTKLAGISHHDAAQSDSFAPGAPLRIVAEPDNPHDPNALGVWNADGTEQAGWVPRAVAAEMSPAERFGVMLGELVEDGRRASAALAVGRTELHLHELPLTAEARLHAARFVRGYRRGLERMREAARFRELAADAFEQLTRGTNAPRSDGA